uniref:Envelope protein n=1 Tax=Avian leukosis virus TaxID=11864 RepID=W0NIH0_ALV|nr:envelope protein [Avian leukosis virus]
MEAVIKAFLTGHPGKVSKKDSKKKPPATSKKDPEKTPLLPSRGYFFFQMILVCVVIISVVPGVGGVHLLQQPGNVWVTWANKTGQTDFCLSLQSATSPFRTCLIGIPQYPLSAFEGYVTNITACQNDTDLASQTACLIQTLNTTLPWDPQELDILGSQMIKNGTNRTCVTFGSVCYGNNGSRVCHIFDGNFNGTGGAEAELRDFITKWKGDDHLITGHRRSRRSVSHLSSDCSDEVQLWSATARIFASFFAPGVAAAQALREIERLACWSVKQANLTSLILNAMLEDMNSIRHAVLQNRAAIDFLLLAQGHGCQDVEGMCCFNLSDHSESIHKALRAMKEHTEKIRVEDDPIGDWFTRTFGSFGGWLAKGVKTLLFALLVIVCLLAIIPCIIKCFQDCLSRTMYQFMDERIRYHRIREQL